MKQNKYTVIQNINKNLFISINLSFFLNSAKILTNVQNDVHLCVCLEIHEFQMTNDHISKEYDCFVDSILIHRGKKKMRFSVEIVFISNCESKN